MTAEDLMRELEADPVWVAKRDARERDRESREKVLREAEKPLVSELRKCGFQVESAWDFVNTSAPYPEAIPILLRHLRRPYPDRIREGIARALAVRDARYAWEELVSLYKREPAGTDTKDGLAVALAAASHREVLEDVISLTGDRRNGASRILLLSALKRSRSPRARKALDEFSSDPELATEILRTTRHLR